MSLRNAMQAVQAWSEALGIDASDRDLSPFITGATLVALADKPVTSAECDLLSQIKQSLTGSDLSWEDFQAEEAWINENGADAAIETIAENITDDGERAMLVRFAALIGVTEGGLNADEGNMLQSLGQGLGFSHHEVLELLGQAMNAANGNF